MKYLALLLPLTVAACSGAPEDQDAVAPLNTAAIFEPFPQDSAEEVFCSLWQEGQDGQALFRSEGGSEGHVATTYYGGETLTLRSSEKSRFGTEPALLYSVDEYPDLRVSLSTRTGEFGIFEGTISMQLKVNDAYENIGNKIAVKGLCAG